MKKKLLTSALILLISVSLITAAYGGSPIKLIVNGKEIKTPVELQTVKGNVMAPVKALAEALGAKVSWDGKANAVKVESPKPDTSEKEKKANIRAEDLEAALIPTSPEDAVGKWAEGVKTRNGALQYAVMTTDLRKQVYSDFEQTYWSTGASSPWVERYSIVPTTQPDVFTYEYRVEMTTATSTGYAGTDTYTVTVVREGGGWYISKVSAAQTQMRDQITLRQYPQAVYDLEKIDLKDPQLNVYFHSNMKIAGIGDCILHYYTIKGQTGVRRLAIEYNKSVYATGVEYSSSSGPFSIEHIDLTGDGRSELMFTVNQDTKVRKTRIISYDSTAQKWKCILEVQNAYAEDLEGDGHKEIISTMLDGRKDYMTIYAWGGSYFNQMDPAQDAAGTYAVPVPKDGRVYIEVGVNGKPILYQYKAGILVPLN